VLAGLKQVEAAAAHLGLPVVMVSAAARVAAQLDLPGSGPKVLPLKLRMRPPWELAL